MKLDGVGLLADGALCTLDVAPGTLLAIVGPAGSGKSRFLRVLLGQDRAAHGSVSQDGPGHVPDGRLAPKAKVQALSRELAIHSSLAGDLLTSPSLWDARQSTIAELTPSQLAAVEVLSVLGHEPGLIGLDGHLDRLDPWALPKVMDGLARECRRGTSVAIVTHQPEIVRQCDVVVVLRGQEVRFCGTVPELLAQSAPTIVTVTTTHQRGVRALVAPMVIDAQETEDGLILTAKPGQDVAARLLAAGYGDVQCVLHRLPTIQDALLAVI